MKILWISDIHINDVNTFYNNFDNLWAEFCISIRKENELSKFTHVIIGGDISFKGDDNEFEYFVKKVNYLKEIFDENIVFLSIPGNHDTEWSLINVAYEKEKEKGIKIVEFVQDIKGDYVENKRSIWRGYNILNSKFTQLKYVSAVANENFKGCLHYDENINVIFVLINSCINSYGNAPLNYLASEFDMQILEDGKKNKNEIFKKLLTVQEIGNQRYILDYILIELKKYDKVIEKFDPLIISVAHHPIEWVNDNQLYSKDLNFKSEIDELLGYSHIHLTGHEHVVPNSIMSYRNNCLILKSGMFCDQELLKDTVFENEKKIMYDNCWYCILESDTMEQINRKVRTRHFKFNYIPKDTKWSQVKSDEYYLYTKNKNIIFNSEIINTNNYKVIDELDEFIFNSSYVTNKGREKLKLLIDSIDVNIDISFEVKGSLKQAYNLDIEENAILLNKSIKLFFELISENYDLKRILDIININDYEFETLEFIEVFKLPFPYWCINKIRSDNLKLVLLKFLNDKLNNSLIKRRFYEIRKAFVSSLNSNTRIPNRFILSLYAYDTEKKLFKFNYLN